MRGRPLEPEWNGRLCPYFARYESLPGHDPEATCTFGCVDEPACVTGAPTGGWPPLADEQVPEDRSVFVEEFTRIDTRGVDVWDATGLVRSEVEDRCPECDNGNVSPCSRCRGTGWLTR